MSHWKGAKFRGDNFEQGAERAFNVSVEEGYYCDVDYTLHIYESLRTALNGRLDFAELRCKECTSPSFLFRWDEKDNHLNVDIQGVPGNIVKSFKRGKGGYKGHRPKQIKSKDKTFEVDIRIPSAQIFHGCIKFNIDHMAKSVLSVGLAVSASYKFTKRNEVNS